MGPLVGVWLCTIFFNGYDTGNWATFDTYDHALADFRVLAAAVKKTRPEEFVIEMRCAYEGV